MGSQMAGATYKSMSSYQLFAWRDAMALGTWLEEFFPITQVKQHFDAMDYSSKADFEFRNQEIIQEIIGRTEGQRPAYLRKVGKQADEITKGLVVLFAMIGQVRVKELLELRDLHFSALNPGSANRVVCSSGYGFIQEIRGIVGYDWPEEVFSAYGGWEDDNQYSE